MKPESELFRETARKAVRRAGWNPKYDLEITGPDQPGHSAVRYGWHSGKVKLAYRPGIHKRVEKAVALVAGASFNSDDTFRNVVAAQVYMQVGSFKVCPYSAYDYAEILEAAADGLRSAGAPEPDVAQYMVPATSFFIASVVCGTYAIDGPDPAGLRRGWAVDQITTSLAQDVDLPVFASICANVQLRLWSDEASIAEALRSRFPASFDVLDFETDRGVAILLDTFAHADAGDGLAWSSEWLRDAVVDELKYNWRAWPVKAFQWAEMLAPYVCAEAGHELPPRPRVQQPNTAERPSDQAQQRRAAVHPSSNVNARGVLQTAGSDSQPLLSTPADPFADRFRSDPAFRQRVIQSGIGRGKNPLDYYMGYEALDALYRSRATRIEIETTTVSRQGMALEVAHMGREELKHGVPELNAIDWGATRFDSDGQMHLYRKTMPVIQETAAKVQMGGFPDLLFVVDSSGSMKWDPKRGTGPYDALLRAIFSVFDFLEKHGKAPYMRFAVVNFSSMTTKTPWHGYPDLRKVKEALFKWQGGGTVLNCRVLDELTASSSDAFLCLMVTDSCIRNATEVLATIERMVRRGHRFVLIQIGAANAMAQGAEALGVPVHLITDPSQLQGLCLEHTRRNYSD